MKRVIKTYDGVIIGTTQKINEDMLESITSYRR